MSDINNKKPLIRFQADVAFKGDQNLGYTLKCRGCGKVLIENVFNRQILDLLIECPICKKINESQNRIPGEPIPTSHVRILTGIYNFGEAVITSQKPSCIVSEFTYKKYLEEVGYNNKGYLASPFGLTYDYLNNIASDAIKLLGKVIPKQLAL